MCVIALLVFIFLACVASEPVPFKPCKTGNTVLAVVMNPCNPASVDDWETCVLQHGMRVRVDAVLIAPFSSAQLETIASSNINGHVIPFPDSGSNPCLENLAPSCPVVKGNMYVFNYVFDVMKYYPTGKMEVVFFIRCKRTKNIIGCVRLPLVIERNPQLTYRS